MVILEIIITVNLNHKRKCETDNVREALNEQLIVDVECVGKVKTQNRWSIQEWYISTKYMLKMFRHYILVQVDLAKEVVYLMNLWIYRYVYVFAYMYIHIYIMCMCGCGCIYMCVCAFIIVYIYIHIYVCACYCVCDFGLIFSLYLHLSRYTFNWYNCANIYVKQTISRPRLFSSSAKIRDSASRNRDSRYTPIYDKEKKMNRRRHPSKRLCSLCELESIEEMDFSLYIRT